MVPQLPTNASGGGDCSPNQEGSRVKNGAFSVKAAASRRKSPASVVVYQSLPCYCLCNFRSQQSFQCFLCGSGGPNLSHLMVKSKFLLDTIGCLLKIIFSGFCTLPHCFLPSFKMDCVTLRAPSTYFTLLQHGSFAFLPTPLHNLSLAASFTVIVS